MSFFSGAPPPPKRPVYRIPGWTAAVEGGALIQGSDEWRLARSSASPFRQGIYLSPSTTAASIQWMSPSAGRASKMVKPGSPSPKRGLKQPGRLTEKLMSSSRTVPPSSAWSGRFRNGSRRSLPEVRSWTLGCVRNGKRIEEQGQVLRGDPRRVPRLPSFGIPSHRRPRPCLTCHSETTRSLRDPSTGGSRRRRGS
jgi:hypothetical protein